MIPFSPAQRRKALLRRRIKFVVETGAMARLFGKGSHAALKEKLGDHLKPRRLSRPFLHIPVDAVVLDYLLGFDPGFPAPRQLKGMTSDDCWRLQNAARQLAHKHRVPAIWFEAAWTA